MTAFALAATALTLAMLALCLRPLLFPAGFARPRKTLTAVAFAVPASALVLYLALGNPAALRAPQGGHGTDTQAEIEKMVSQYAERLQANPGDAKGWALLARSYKVMNRPAEAVQAYEKAMPSIQRDAQELANYADAAASLAGGRLEGRPMQLVQQALRVDPDHPMALWLAGTAALQAKDYDRAIAHWERLRKLLPPDGDDAREIRGALAEARALAGQPVANEPAASVSGTVELGADVRGKVQPGDVLMVIARPLGARMPVAVIRASAAALPATFTLDDSRAMNPQARISGLDMVEVEARISRTGQAQAQPGDLYSAVQTVKVGAAGVKLQVDRVR